MTSVTSPFTPSLPTSKLSQMLNKSAELLSSSSTGTRSHMSPGSVPSQSPTAGGGSGCGHQLYTHLKSVLTRPGIALSDRICEINRHLLPSVSPSSYSQRGLMSEMQQEQQPTYTPRDLDPVFLLIMQDVFGSAHVKSVPGSATAMRYPVSNAHHHVGWGLCGISRNKHYRDFNAAFSFLCSSGTIMQLVEFLSHDASCAFEFPVSKLPSGLQNHHQQQHPVMQNREGEAVCMLSPIEYFIFHFVSLVASGPEWNQGGSFLVDNDSLYPAIFEDYLASFLAMGGATFKTHDVPQPNPHTLLRPPLQCSPTFSRPSLLKADLFAATAPRSAAFPPSIGSVSSEMWRANVFVSAVTQMWVNSSQYQARVPSSDVVKLVRMFIKHTHYFFNSFYPNQVFHLFSGPIPRIRTTRSSFIRDVGFCQLVPYLLILVKKNIES